MLPGSRIRRPHSSSPQSTPLPAPHPLCGQPSPAFRVHKSPSLMRNCTSDADPLQTWDIVSKHNINGNEPPDAQRCNQYLVFSPWADKCLSQVQFVDAYEHHGQHPDSQSVAKRRSVNHHNGCGIGNSILDYRGPDRGHDWRSSRATTDRHRCSPPYTRLTGRRAQGSWKRN